MTEQLLHELETKTLLVLDEIESLRKENMRLNHENTALKYARESDAKKLHDLVSLLDAVNPVEPQVNAVNLAAVKSAVIQG